MRNEGLDVRSEVIRGLQKEVIALQNGKALFMDQVQEMGLGPIKAAFPGRTFPTGAIHELISPTREDASSTNGFISGLLSHLMQKAGMCLWVSTRRTLFPPALKAFGIDPDRILFIDVTRPKDALWTIEEGLKCGSLTSVVGELQELSFTESRRLQLAVEESRVTGFIHRYKPRSENTVACFTRWKISPIRSVTETGMPGVGYPRWNVQLTKVRNGRPGTWQVEWAADSFQFLIRSRSVSEIETRKAG